MKASEIIDINRDKIIDEMIECEKSVLDNHGRIQYKIYIWSDGEIETLQEPSGGTGWLQPKDRESRDLYFVVKIAEPFFDPWECTCEAPPEDEDERSAMEDEIIADCMTEYDACEILDDALEEIKRDEEYEEEKRRYDELLRRW